QDRRIKPLCQPSAMLQNNGFGSGRASRRLTCKQASLRRKKAVNLTGCRDRHKRYARRGQRFARVSVTAWVPLGKTGTLRSSKCRCFVPTGVSTITFNNIMHHQLLAAAACHKNQAEIVETFQTVR
ncbi:MAG: hypothetical protein ACK4N4_16235, partial [Burkholderiales bacterium]